MGGPGQGAPEVENKKIAHFYSFAIFDTLKLYIALVWVAINAKHCLFGNYISFSSPISPHKGVKITLAPAQEGSKGCEIMKLSRILVL